MYRRIDKAVGWLARAVALAGGAVLIALVIMVCVSITGRALIPLGLKPVSGDVELLEMGMAFAIFAFLPYCQYVRGHARVDLFQQSFGNVGNRVLDLVADVGMAFAAIIIAWRLWLGMLDKKSYFETTFILQIEIWQAYAAALVGAAAFVIVSVFCVFRSLKALPGGGV
ncbi:TRAP-type C4-dicarboxylate transport system permease small subunit [Shimia isoporae]|uniref:TRAP transporter small permease protein n=1 Tax=Shimia isoporae TaxID=647720 RepID=A0A4R1N4I8_9RHOB|nr:TRAP transporter small permease subunit [Shimia isoporae]TCK98974.1 TRAP-type C4-dicarboxylate transport system permease small subunit [Shimia isoporae]